MPWVTATKRDPEDMTMAPPAGGCRLSPLLRFFRGGDNSPDVDHYRAINSQRLGKPLQPANGAFHRLLSYKIFFFDLTKVFYRHIQNPFIL